MKERVGGLSREPRKPRGVSGVRVSLSLSSCYLWRSDWASCCLSSGRDFLMPLQRIRFALRRGRPSTRSLALRPRVQLVSFHSRPLSHACAFFPTWRAVAPIFRSAVLKIARGAVHAGELWSEVTGARGQRFRFLFLLDLNGRVVTHAASLAVGCRAAPSSPVDEQICQLQHRELI